MFSFRIISGSLERQAKSLYLSANRFSVQRENSVKEGEKLSTKKTLNFRTFSDFQKIRQSRSYIAHTLYGHYLVFSL
uniref:Uncharacterized protein n=1 Tax=virus sp. ctML55 TaxID=2827627 RepID=A0A8S5RI51_9VIRU|nr:MAG TPA: hypothetical protein [virus sp. ctML55]